MKFIAFIKHKIKILSKMLYLTGFNLVITYHLPTFNVLSKILSSFGIKFKNKLVKVKIRGYENPVFLRYGSSDIFSLKQIFAEEEFSCLKKLEHPQLIIDCGANVGYASFYFLNQFPGVKIVAVEPDSANFEVCKKNLVPYQDQISLFQAGVWSKQANLTIKRYGMGLEWGIEVKESEPGETPDILATTIDQLLASTGMDTIDVLKVDIEGSEIEVFGKNFEQWLKKVKNLVIELHGSDCEKIFFTALSNYDYELLYAGELVVCKNLKPKV